MGKQASYKHITKAKRGLENLRIVLYPSLFLMVSYILFLYIANNLFNIFISKNLGL